MYIIALIGIGLFLHGFILMTFTAFKVNKQWGLAVLLVPFAQIFFPVYHWRKSKTAFSSLILGLSLWMGTAIIFGEGALDEYWLDTVNQAQNTEFIANKPKVLTQPLEQRVKKHQKTGTHAFKSRRVIKQKKYRSINVNRLHNFTGENIKITLHNKIIRVGILSAVKPDSIELHNYLGSGELSYKISLNRISSASIAIYRQ